MILTLTTLVEYRHRLISTSCLHLEVECPAMIADRTLDLDLIELSKRIRHDIIDDFSFEIEVASDLSGGTEGVGACGAVEDDPAGRTLHRDKELVGAVGTVARHITHTH